MLMRTELKYVSHNLKGNDEDVSNLDGIFDDKDENIDKSPTTDSSTEAEPELARDEGENGGQDKAQEESGNGGTEARKEEVRQEQEPPTFNDSSSPESTSASMAQNDTTNNESAGEAPVTRTVVAPSSGSDSRFYAIRTTGGQERVVANVLQNKIKSKNIGIYSILLLENFKGYIIVEAPDANVAFQALAGVRHIRGQIRGELPFKDIEGYLVKKPVVTELSVDDTVEVIGGPFKAMKAKITRVDYEKQEATVVLLDSPYQIPVTVDANYLKKATR
jgi:transcription termination/antitermination protein NusG